MLKWVFFIGLGFQVIKLAEEYLHPSAASNEKSTSGERRTVGRRRKLYPRARLFTGRFRMSSSNR